MHFKYYFDLLEVATWDIGLRRIRSLNPDSAVVGVCVYVYVSVCAVYEPFEIFTSMGWKRMETPNLSFFPFNTFFKIRRWWISIEYYWTFFSFPFTQREDKNKQKGNTVNFLSCILLSEWTLTLSCLELSWLTQKAKSWKTLSLPVVDTLWGPTCKDRELMLYVVTAWAQVKEEFRWAFKNILLPYVLYFIEIFC